MRILVGLSLCALLVVGLAWMLGQGQGDPSSVMEVRPGSGTRLDPRGPTPTDAPDDRATESPAPSSRVTAPVPARASGIREPRLHGRVLDQETGEPLGGMRLQVHFSGAGWSPISVTDEEGLFEAPLPADWGQVILRCLGEEGSAQSRWRIEPLKLSMAEVAKASEAGETGEPVEFRVEPAVGALSARILMPDGSPALACRVVMNSGEEPVHGSWSSSEPVGPGGLWRRTLFRSDLRGPIHLEARKLGGRLRSEVLTLRPPIPSEPVELRLVELAEVSGRVTDVDGTPIEGVEIQIIQGPAGEGGRFAGIGDRTGHDGSYCLYGLRPGEYTLSLSHEPSHRNVERSLSIRSCSKLSRDLRLDAGPVRLALSGVVLQHDHGGGISRRGADRERIEVLGVEPRDGVRTSYYTDTYGHFEIWLPPAKTVEIRVGARVWSDRYEPEVLNYAFGTRDVEIQPAEIFDDGLLHLQLWDAQGGGLITEVQAWVRNSHGDSRKLWASPGLSARESPRPPPMVAHPFLPPFIVLKANPELELGLAAEGYLPCIRRLGDLRKGDEFVLEAALEPGFAATLELVDDESGEPIEGAELRLQDQLVGVSDSRGRMRLVLPERPEDRLEIGHPAHRLRRWTPKLTPWEQRVTLPRKPEEPKPGD